MAKSLVAAAWIWNEPGWLRRRQARTNSWPSLISLRSEVMAVEDQLDPDTLVDDCDAQRTGLAVVQRRHTVEGVR